MAIASGAALGLTSCSHGGSAEVEMEVRSVGMDDTLRAPVVLLQDKAHEIALPIWIGANEAQAIATCLEGLTPPRPMTHDLLKNVIDAAGIGLDRVVIVDLREGTYLARIHLQSGRRDLAVDSRPSDAIALAVRFKRPIFVAPALLRGEGAVNLRRLIGPDTLTVRGITVQSLSGDLAEFFSVTPGNGVVVAASDSRAGGTARGDVIVAINGEPIAGISDFAERMERLGAEAADLVVVRNGSRLAISLGPEAPVVD